MGNRQWAVSLLLIVLAGCENRQLGDPRYLDEAVGWGQAVNGLQVGIARRDYEAGFQPEKGQDYYAVILRNTSAKEIKFLSPVVMSGYIPEELAGDESVQIVLTYDSQAGLKTATFNPPKKPVIHTLEPGKTFKMELRLSPSKFGLEHFVGGTISAAYVNHQAAIKYSTLGGETVGGVWTGDARSLPVKVDAAAPATQKTSLREDRGSEVQTSSPSPRPSPAGGEGE